MKTPSTAESSDAPSERAEENVKRVVHLIPSDGIGGVETAVRSMGMLKREGFLNFDVDFIFNGVPSSRVRQRWRVFSTLPLLLAARKLNAGHVDLLIVSLWRAAIVGLLAKWLRPKLKLVVFIHNATDVHWVDFIFTRMATSLADEVWADCQASLRERLPHLASGKCRVISFVTQRFNVQPTGGVRPDFIFWGRINAQKGLDRALRIFAEVLKRQPVARFWIIGPEAGVLDPIQALCDSLNLTGSVFFLGAATLPEVEKHAGKAAFYLQTSLFEGMAMSVVEAMQMGLVPIVTPVGEIPSYCCHGANALIVKSDQQVVMDIMDLLSDGKKYEEMRLNAIETWRGVPLYKDSILEACRELLSANKRQYANL